MANVLALVCLSPVVADIHQDTCTACGDDHTLQYLLQMPHERQTPMSICVQGELSHLLWVCADAVSYTHLRAHETRRHL
eukprot:9667816-Prorocentrum_lima.AAC.1